MQPKILLVEDEKNFGMVMRDYLSMNGYEVTLCENGELGLDAFKKETFDLCIVDVMMPKKDGFTLAAEIKTINKNVPFVFLTARGMREDLIKGYKLGADDYLTKPFDSEVLLLKLKAILNRNSFDNPNEFLHEIGKFSFNAKLRTLRSEKNKEEKLSPKEAALLNLLCHHKNDVLPREKALKQIWNDDSYFTGRSMDVYIVKLRKYLAPDPNVEINNLHGNGYSLIIKT
ncbi:MAG TPA: response regulator transcription factor [Bacteroidia bacterium]|jgi:two-component system OmpR family response regulator|nr:response regulator transcription factor [Bacteroidia bacterium]